MLHLNSSSQCDCNGSVERENINSLNLHFPSQQIIQNLFFISVIPITVCFKRENKKLNLLNLYSPIQKCMGYWDGVITFLSLPCALSNVCIQNSAVCVYCILCIVRESSNQIILFKACTKSILFTSFISIEHILYIYKRIRNIIYMYTINTTEYMVY